MRGCSRTPASSPAATSGGGAIGSAPIERSAEAEGLGDAYDFLSKEASTVPAGAEGLVFLPCMQGAMAPEWNGAARGVFYGLTLAHTRAHMTRAVLEGARSACGTSSRPCGMPDSRRGG